MGYVTDFKGLEIGDIDLDGNDELIIYKGSGFRGAVHEIDLSSNSPLIGTKIWESGNRLDNRETRIGDIDGDGLVDMVQFHYRNPSEYTLGIADTDNDAIPDSIDEYPFDPTQKDDTDSDGYGSSNTGMLGDDCPYYWGDSTEDRRGCPDQDGDGWSDLNDAFWRDSTQWTDVDGDGQGDNATGNNPDQYIYDFDNDGFNDSTLSSIGASSPYDTCKYTF
jgi:hypothetical protein